jgi:FkbM family methyltransferase
MKRHLKRIIRTLGFELRRVEPGRDLISFVTSRQISLVLDVGANIGQFAADLRNGGYSGKIVSFEPISSVFTELSGNAKGDPSWHVVNAALGRTSGTATINVSEETVYSSILHQTDYAEEFHPGARAQRQETVKLARLDEVFNYPGERVLLKIDTQGFERDVLDGASSALQSIEAVWLELPVVHLYSGVWGLEEAFAYMSERGFALSQIKPVNSRWEDPVLEVDCLFRRR